MIYVHIPFCHRKCTYCAFYSRPMAGGRWSMSGYVDALLQEMEDRRGEQAHPIKTVYFGGGTPSILPLDELARVVDGLRRNFDIGNVEEMTIECNPEDLTPDYLNGLRTLGFNRISIGVQSLDDEVLRLVGRRHTAQQAVEAVQNAHSSGFRNISVDFIYGITSCANLDSLTPLCDIVTHVSAYALTVEPGTALAVQVEQGRVVLPDEDEVVRQYRAMRRFLEGKGFVQYEVSNFARPGFRSRHNSRYWDRTPYLGLGSAAHSFDGCRRRWNVADIETYISSHAFEEEQLTKEDAHNELLMTALRTTDGLPCSAVPKEQMQPYVDCGWIEIQSNRYCPTAEGLLHADGIAAALFV